jgi:glycosyltransferase involved in cell wall biosynthesis
MRFAVNATFIVPYIGGTQVYLENLIREMTRIDTANHYELFVSDFSKRYFPTGRSNISFHRVRPLGLSRLLRILWEQSELPRRLSRVGASLCFAPGYTVPLRARCPVVVTIHDMQWYHHPDFSSRAKAWYYRRMITAAAKRADAILTVSEYSRQDIITNLGVGPSRVHAIHLAPNEVVKPPENPEDIERIRRMLGIRGPYVLYVGRFNPHKNIPTLLRAFARAASAGDFPQTLVLVGRRARALREIKATIAELGLGDQVVMADFLPEVLLRVPLAL